MKVLIAEDDPISRRLLETILSKWGYDVQISCNGREAWELLQQPDAASLVISDWMMPVMDGVQLCNQIRHMERSGYIYFILLTTKESKADVIQGLESGADDFVIKPFNREELKYRVKIGERIIRLEQRILQLANTDSLTGLLNRRAFIARMDSEIERSRREKCILSLIVADIDFFKRINDRYGHQVGDLVLQEFAKTLSTSSRSYDFAGRYGGEEFMVCLPGADSAESSSIAERMRANVEEMRITLPDDSKFIQTTASFGTASFSSGFRETLESLFKRADEALYEAKRRGRNCVVSAAGAS